MLMKRRWRDLSISAVVSFGLVLPWFIWSYLKFDSLLPLSGVAKMAVFQSDRLWVGFENFCHNTPYLLMGYELKDSLPHQMAFAMGIIILYSVLRDWKKTGWASILVLIMIFMYGSFTNPNSVPQFVRYCVPAIVILGIILFSRKMKPHALVPVFLACAVLYWSYGFYSWSARTGTLPTFVGLGQAQIPEILEEIAGPDDVIGCFDSGSIGYFASQPVVNLDGLVNSQVIKMLKADNGGTWTTRYRNYFESKGITIMVGGTAFSWVNFFPDLEDWDVLHEPLNAVNGQVVFLRVPKLIEGDMSDIGLESGN